MELKLVPNDARGCIVCHMLFIPLSVNHPAYVCSSECERSLKSEVYKSKPKSKIKFK